MESGKSPLEFLDGLVVHARCAAVARDLLERCPQIPFGKDLVKQSKPFSSFHSLFQSRQHANGPSARFDPSPSREDLFGLLSLRHCRRLVFRWLGHSSSIFLVPFAPPALPGFLATMEPLTPVQRLFEPPGAMNSVWFRTGLPVSCVWPSFHSISNHLTRPRGHFDTQPLSATSPHFRGLGLRHCFAGSPNGPAESSSLKLRTGSSPPVALHLASWRRSYVQLQAGVRIPEKDLHLSDQTHLQTHKAAPRQDQSGNKFPHSKVALLPRRKKLELLDRRHFAGL